MNKNDLEFCELLCAKFCHDLSGPIGAINNGIDFLDSENSNMKEKAAELVKLSSNQAVNRLAFFRQAYGSYSADSKVDVMQLKSLIHKFIQDTKISVQFDSNGSQDLEIEHILSKILLNLVMVTSGIILLNGEIKISFYGKSDLEEIKINAVGPVVKVDEDLLTLLKGDVSSIAKTTRNIQQYYTRYLLDQTDIAIQVQIDKSGVQIDLKI